MAKAKLTQAQLDALIERFEDLAPDLVEATDSIRKNLGFADDVTRPARFAGAAVGLSAKAADLARAVLILLDHAEDRRLLEVQMRERAESAIRPVTEPRKDTP